MTRLDYADFLPLFPLETEEAIRARMNAWANEGLSGGDPAIVDTRQGSFFQIMTEGAVRGDAKIYDRMSEVMAMSNPIFAGGYYLDLLATSRGLPRLAATKATGEVLFSGPNGTVIPSGTRVSASGANPGDPAITFETTESVAIPAGLSVAADIQALEGGVAGNLGVGAITSLDTPLTGVTVTNTVPTGGGAEVESDDLLAQRVIESFQVVGAANISMIKGWALAFPTVGRATVRPNYYGPGTVLLIVSTADGSPVSAATLLDIQTQLDPPTLTTTLTAQVILPATPIPVVTTAGARSADVAPDYIMVGSQVVQYTDITATSFTGATGGTGTQPIGTTVVQRGSGAGKAPIGMYLIVKTTTLLAVDVIVKVHLASGFGIATAGYTDVTGFIRAALEDYIDKVEPGEKIYLSQVFARTAEAQGVVDADYDDFRIEGLFADLQISADPAQKPYLDTLTIVPF